MSHDADVTKNRARKLAAEAIIAEIAVAERQGKLLHVDDHVELVRQVAEELRSRILAMPGKWAPRVPGAKTMAEAQALLRELANDLLATLQSVGGDLAGRDDTDPEPRVAKRTSTRHQGAPRGPRTRAASHR